MSMLVKKLRLAKPKHIVAIKWDSGLEQQQQGVFVPKFGTS